MDLYRRDESEEVHTFVNPYTELNVGLWLLFLSATAFLGLRVWVKINWRHGLWYDDWVLILSWVSTSAFDKCLAPFPYRSALKTFAYIWW